jgi:hypothetical protein
MLRAVKAGAATKAARERKDAAYVAYAGGAEGAGQARRAGRLCTRLAAWADPTGRGVISKSYDTPLEHKLMRKLDAFILHHFERFCHWTQRGIGWRSVEWERVSMGAAIVVFALRDMPDDWAKHSGWVWMGLLSNNGMGYGWCPCGMDEIQQCPTGPQKQIREAVGIADLSADLCFAKFSRLLLGRAVRLDSVHSSRYLFSICH